MRQKEKDAEDRLTSAKEKASQEIASLTSELTIKAVKKPLPNIWTTQHNQN